MLCLMPDTLVNQLMSRKDTVHTPRNPAFSAVTSLRLRG